MGSLARSWYSWSHLTVATSTIAVDPAAYPQPPDGGYIHVSVLHPDQPSKQSNRAQKCSPVKFCSRSLYVLAKWIALLPLIYSATSDFPYFGPKYLSQMRPQLHIQ